MLNVDFWSLFIHLYDVAQGAYGEVPSVYARLISLGEIIAIVGLSVSFILLVLIVYVEIRLHEVEHHGFHAREMHEHAAHSAHPHIAKNPAWETVVMLASSPNESDWRRAILEADIMLSNMMREHGYTGGDIGEQFANANPLQFTTIDIAREAHRMRNALAHLGEAFPLTERDARATIDQYRRAFEEFDYI